MTDAERAATDPLRMREERDHYREEVLRLRAHNRELRAALEPLRDFHTLGKLYDPVEVARKAAAALATAPKEGSQASLNYRR